VYAPLLIVVGILAGRSLAERVPPRLVALGLGVVSLWLVLGVALTPEPGKLPIGYPNANAALAVQLVALCGLVALNPPARRRALVALALGVLAVVANRSAAGLIVVVPVVLAVLLALWLSPARRRWPAAAVGILALSSTTVVLVVLSRRAAWPSVALQAFDEVRRALWLTGWEAFRSAESFGLGPGGFENVNRFTDPDVTSAHSLPIQVAVELGMVGLGLLVLLYLCGLAVALSASTAAQSWIATAGWSALAVHAFVDHLLEYWPIPLAAGLVLGYGLVSKTQPQPEDEVV
jgi:O-antigen ligase